jgi:hypothetical protein
MTTGKAAAPIAAVIAEPAGTARVSNDSNEWRTSRLRRGECARTERPNIFIGLHQCHPVKNDPVHNE